MKRVVALVLLGTVLGAAHAVAQTPPPPSPATKLQVSDATDLGCTLSVTPDPNVKLGERITVYNGSSRFETVTQREEFWNVSLGVGAEKSVRVFGAGMYLSACEVGEWKAPLRARPSAPGSPATNSFRATWAVDVAPATWRYGVQYRIGQGDWATVEVRDGSQVGDLQRGEWEDLLLQGPDHQTIGGPGIRLATCPQSRDVIRRHGDPPDGEGRR